MGRGATEGLSETPILREGNASSDNHKEVVNSKDLALRLRDIYQAKFIDSVADKGIIQIQTMLSQLKWESSKDQILSRYLLFKIGKVLKENDFDDFSQKYSLGDLAEEIAATLPESERSTFYSLMEKDFSEDEASESFYRQLEKAGIAFEKMSDAFDAGSIRFADGSEFAFYKGHLVPNNKGIGDGSIQNIKTSTILSSCHELKNLLPSIAEITELLSQEKSDSVFSVILDDPLVQRLKEIDLAGNLEKLENLLLESDHDPLKATEARITYINILTALDELKREERRYGSGDGKKNDMINLFAQKEEKKEKKEKDAEDLEKENLIEEQLSLIKEKVGKISTPMIEEAQKRASAKGIDLPSNGSYLQYLLFEEAVDELEDWESGNREELMGYLKNYLGDDPTNWSEEIIEGKKSDREMKNSDLRSWVSQMHQAGGESSPGRESIQQRQQVFSRLIFGAKVVEESPRLRPLVDRVAEREDVIRKKASVGGKTPETPIIALPNQGWFQMQSVPGINLEPKTVYGEKHMAGHHFPNDFFRPSIIYINTIASQDTRPTQEEKLQRAEEVVVHELIHAGQPHTVSEDAALEIHIKNTEKEGRKISLTVDMMRTSINEGLTELLAQVRSRSDVAQDTTKKSLDYIISYRGEVLAWVDVLDRLGVKQEEREPLLDLFNSLPIDQVVSYMDKLMKERRIGGSFLALWDDTLPSDASTRSAM